MIFSDFSIDKVYLFLHHIFSQVNLYLSMISRNILFEFFKYNVKIKKIVTSFFSSALK